MQGNFEPKTDSPELDMIDFCHEIQDLYVMYMVVCGKKNPTGGFDLYVYILKRQKDMVLLDKNGIVVKNT